jgi:hypothetical protein
MKRTFTPYWLYFSSFAVIISGLIVYFWQTPRVRILAMLPDDICNFGRSTADIRVPSYVTRRGEAVAEASEDRKQDA